MVAVADERWLLARGNFWCFGNWSLRRGGRLQVVTTGGSTVYCQTFYLPCVLIGRKVLTDMHSCPILSNRFHPTKQHSICCRSENCISLAISGQSAVDSIDSFHLSNGKVYYRFDKCGCRSDNRISLVTTATRCKIVESIDSFDWWEWLFHSRFHIKSLSNRRVHVNED